MSLIPMLTRWRSRPQSVEAQGDGQTRDDRAAGVLEQVIPIRFERGFQVGHLRVDAVVDAVQLVDAVGMLKQMISVDETMKWGADTCQNCDATIGYFLSILDLQ